MLDQQKYTFFLRFTLEFFTVLHYFFIILGNILLVYSYKKNSGISHTVGCYENTLLTSDYGGKIVAIQKYVDIFSGIKFKVAQNMCVEILLVQ